MRGHQPIVAMRHRHLMPPAVWVSTEQNDLWRDWALYGGNAHVEVEADDSPRRLDLRWVVGVPVVWVEGADKGRLMAVAKAFRDAGAKRVIAHLYAADKLVFVADTEGVLTWRN